MAVCPRCREDVSPDDERCASCGTDLRARGARPGDVILVLDRGLVQFGKFSLAVLGLFLIFGAFVFGFDLRNLVDEMEERRQELAAASERISRASEETGRLLDEVAAASDASAASIARLASDAERARQGVQETTASIEQRIAEVTAQIDDLKAKLAEAEAELSKIRSSRRQAELLIGDMARLATGSIAPLPR